VKAMKDHGLTSGLLGWPFAPDETWEMTGAFKGKNIHEGVDWACARGTPIYAVAPGKVAEVTNRHFSKELAPGEKLDETANGTIVRINTCLDEGGIDFQHVYLHLQPGSVRVTEGKEVKPYQLLGLAGNTGNSTNPHLHLQLQSAVAPRTPFDFYDFLDHHRSRTLKEAYKGPKLKVGREVVLKVGPSNTSANVTFKDAQDASVDVSTSLEDWYDIVGRAADNWWQIVVENDDHEREDVGWIRMTESFSDRDHFKGKEEWVHNTYPELPDTVLRPSNAPPTMLRVAPSVTPDTTTLRWAAPAADGITGYRFWGNTVPSPLGMLGREHTGSDNTEASGFSAYYSHGYFRVAAIRGTEIGQLSNLVIVRPINVIPIRYTNDTYAWGFQ